jgi:hypothetical protein
MLGPKDGEIFEHMPPEYIRATTAPASDSPSRSAVAIDNRATASTPTRPERKSRTIEAASPSKTGIVASVQARWATRGWSTARARIPVASPMIATVTSDHRRARSGTSAFCPAEHSKFACRIVSSWLGNARNGLLHCESIDLTNVKYLASFRVTAIARVIHKTSQEPQIGSLLHAPFSREWSHSLNLT